MAKNIKKDNSKYIFIILLIIYIIIIIYYIILKNTNKVDNSSGIIPETNLNTNYFFYNHTGFSNLNTFGDCYSFTVNNVSNNFVIDYNNFFVKQCLDTNYVNGIQGYRFCEKEDGCLDFNGILVNKGKKVDYNLNNADITRLPTCDLKICGGYVGRIISFIDKQPFCMTITPNENNISSMILEKTAFLKCDILNRNQIFIIENVNNTEDKQDFLIKIYSRSMQQYLYVDSNGRLNLTNQPNFQKFWFYTPTISIDENNIIPSQIVFMDYDKINEYSNYESNITKGYITDLSPIFDNESNLKNIKLETDYSSILSNLYSLSPIGYLSSRQYVQSCKKNGVGNSYCLSELMIIRENEFVQKIENNNLKYSYTGKNI